MIATLVTSALALHASQAWTGNERMIQARCGLTHGEDSIRVIEHLRSAGYSRIRFAAARGRYYAMLAEKADSGFVLTLGVCADGVTPLAEPGPLGFSTPHLEWVDLQGDGTFALVETYDDRAEAEVGTLVHALVNGTRLDRIYQDREAICRPAEVKDLDGDGRLELLVFSEDPSGGDCGDQCHFTLSKRFEGFTPGWVEVRQWDGVQ